MEPLAPTHLYAQARRLDVDLAREPFLLPLMRQAATTPVPPHHFATDENQHSTTDGGYFQQQVSDLRAHHVTDLQPVNAWVEFEDRDGAVYYFDFVSESRQDTHPLVQLRDSAIGGGGGGSTANTADPEVFERATALHKLSSVKNLEQLEILCFHTWWTELSLQGAAHKRLAHIYFSVPTRHFQVVLEDADDVFTISHIASLLTRQWLQLHERRLGDAKRQLQTELAKYELKAHGRPHQAGRIECADPHRSQAGCSLRQLLGDIASLKNKLAGYRPDLARRICATIPDEDE